MTFPRVYAAKNAMENNRISYPYIPNIEKAHLLMIVRPKFLKPLL
jgi:hypothetical protein